MPPAAGAVWKARESQLRALRVGFFGELCEITVFPRAAGEGEWKKNNEKHFWCSCKQAEPRDPGDDLPLQSRIIWGFYFCLPHLTPLLLLSSQGRVEELERCRGGSEAANKT